MNSSEYIFSKQVTWVRNQGIGLVGSKGAHGRPAYTKTLDKNLFEPLAQQVINDFNAGDGGELNGKPDSLPKMHAVHSSSALGVNIFRYWLRIDQIPKIAAACRLCSKNNTLSQPFILMQLTMNRMRFAQCWIQKSNAGTQSKSESQMSSSWWDRW